MTNTILQGGRVPIRLWAPPHEVDTNAMRQLRGVANLPWVAHHVAVMPDVHVGKGATVGSVVALQGAVCPAAVGVDIGCGMAAVKTSLTASRLPDSLKRLRSAIESAVPVGRGQHRALAWERANKELKTECQSLFDGIRDVAPVARGISHSAHHQLGTLGGGNHFIELCLDQQQGVWAMLHTGSRRVGAALAEYHMAAAARLLHNQTLPDPDLAVFLSGSRAFDAYRHDLFWAQRYAALNRTLILELLTSVLRKHFPDVKFESPIACHHNYVAEEHHFGTDLLVTRKGAIRAGLGEMGIIPGSMGAKSYIVRGLGNAWSFESASHGAGRRLSRTQARNAFTVEDLERQTQGVECRKDRGVLDEAPHAYKDIDQVMERQRDLVEIVAELKQVLCVKG